MCLVDAEQDACSHTGCCPTRPLPQQTRLPLLAFDVFSRTPHTVVMSDQLIVPPTETELNFAFLYLVGTIGALLVPQQTSAPPFRTPQVSPSDRRPSVAAKAGPLPRAARQEGHFPVGSSHNGERGVIGTITPE